MAKAKTQKNKTSTFYDHLNIVAGLFFVLAFAVITGLSGYSALAAKPQPALTAPNLTLIPLSGRLSSGSVLSLQIWTDTGSQSVNAVRADLNYPIDKLNYVNVDTTNTAFGVQAEGSGANGTVSIERGSVNPVSGHLLVATVNFTPLPHKAKSSAAVNFANTSKLLSATSNSDVLSATYGGSYSF